MSRRQVVMACAVDAITVGHRHRQDLGDLDGLVESVRDVGLLEPISITPAGVLVTGYRRLLALKKLGTRTTDVWITDTSSRLEELLAEQHENLHRKDLTPTEAASLWAELKDQYAQAAAHGRPRKDTAETENPCESHDFPPGTDRRSRVRAARVLTGRDSSQRLARVDEIVRLAADESLPAELRRELAEQLAQMDATGKVHGAYQRARELVDDHRRSARRPDPGGSGHDGVPAQRGWREVDGTLRARLALRHLVEASVELDGWWDLVDAERLRASADPQQVRQVVAFLRRSLDYLTAGASQSDEPVSSVHAC